MFCLVMNQDKGHNRCCTDVVIQTLNDNKSFHFSECLLVVQSSSLQMTLPMEDDVGSGVKAD